MSISSPRRILRGGKVTLALALVLCASPARADETEAERLFREGRALMLQGRFDEACPKIAESQKLDPHTGTLLNLAACHERQGKIGTAWVEYQKGLTAARAEGQGDRERLALDRIAVLEPRVPWLNVTSAANSPEDLAIALDGAPLPKVEWAKDLPMDPGAHLVAGSAPGRPPFEARVELREGEHRAVTVTVGEAPPAAEAKPATVVVEPAPAAPPAQAEKKAEEPGRWRFDVGFFVGFLDVNATNARPQDPGSIAVRDASGHDSTCASQSCSYSLPHAEQVGAVTGIRLYAGYALSDAFTVGAMFMAGPRLAHADSGGFMFALGPAASLRASGAIRISAALLAGDASVSGYGRVSSPYSGDTPIMDASINGGAGVALSVDIEILRLPRGALDANVFPFFLAGDRGTAWGFPLGVSYRFQ